MSYRFKLDPMPSVQWDFLTGNGYTREVPFEHDGMNTLKLRLLAHCGFAVVFRGFDEDLAKILKRGEAQRGSKAVMMPGKVCGCHENSARLWHLDSERYTICTGYAMSRDGIWRQHSWCIEYRYTERERIVETTEKRLLYFGFAMDEDEASLFHYENDF